MSEAEHDTRGLQAALAAAVVMLGAREAHAAKSRLLVFLHVALKQRAFQNKLAAAMSGIEVTAVGRVADFDRALAAGQDAVLSLPEVLQARGLGIKLQGYRGGKPDEVYALVAAGSVPEPARIKVVGALDLFGRTGTNHFVSRLVGASPRVERVTKVEDLLALLQMQRVDAILLPVRLVAELRTMSRLNLIQKELGPRVGLPAAAIVGPGGQQALAAVARLPAAASRIVGVDEWR
ncbi:MAG: hypothetical protein JW940_23350 [Polyangiaceae bacterium]|nr:hypothetical protein [Polyangiaceae bacterium]